MRTVELHIIKPTLASGRALSQSPDPDEHEAQRGRFDVVVDSQLQMYVNVKRPAMRRQTVATRAVLTYFKYEAEVKKIWRITLLCIFFRMYNRFPNLQVGGPFDSGNSEVK